MYRGGEEEILPGPKLILGNLYLEAEMVYSPETS